MNLILLGLPGVGKSTVSKLLAEKLQWQRIETDKELVQFYQKLNGEFLNTRAIYKKVGDATFRQLENTILLHYINSHHCVFDIGGGTLNDPQNVQLLKSMGRMIYLKAENLKEIFERLMLKGLPSYLDAENPYGSFLDMASQRMAIYEQAADITVAVENNTPSKIVDLIIAALEGK